MGHINKHVQQHISGTLRPFPLPTGTDAAVEGMTWGDGTFISWGDGTQVDWSNP